MQGKWGIKQIYTSIILSLLYLSLPLISPLNVVHAHVLQTDGSIGGILHINPDDDPIINEETTFFIEFKDKNNNFTLDKCDCNAEITKDQEVIFREPLGNSAMHPNPNSPSFHYTFEEKGIYSIKVKGEPYQGGNFNPFELKYTIRVERTIQKTAGSLEEPAETENNTFLYIFIGLTITIFLIIIFAPRKKDLSKNTKAQKILSLLLPFVLFAAPIINYTSASLHKLHHTHSEKAVTLQHNHNDCPCFLSRVNQLSPTAVIKTAITLQKVTFFVPLQKITLGPSSLLRNKSPPQFS